MPSHESPLVERLRRIDRRLLVLDRRVGELRAERARILTRLYGVREPGPGLHPRPGHRPQGPYPQWPEQWSAPQEQQAQQPGHGSQGPGRTPGPYPWPEWAPQWQVPERQEQQPGPQHPEPQQASQQSPQPQAERAPEPHAQWQPPQRWEQWPEPQRAPRPESERPSHPGPDPALFHPARRPELSAHTSAGFAASARRPAVSPEVRRRSARNVVLGLGAALMSVAALVFAVWAWTAADTGGRALMLLGVTGAVAWAAVPLHRRGLTATAQTFGVLLVVFLLVDALLLWLMLGPDVDPAGYTAVAALAVAGLLVLHGRLVPLRTNTPMAVVVAQPVPLLTVAALWPDGGPGLWTLPVIAATGLAGALLLRVFAPVGLRASSATMAALALLFLPPATTGAVEPHTGWVLAATLLPVGATGLLLASGKQRGVTAPACVVLLGLAPLIASRTSAVLVPGPLAWWWADDPGLLGEPASVMLGAQRAVPAVELPMLLGPVLASAIAGTVVVHLLSRTHLVAHLALAVPLTLLPAALLAGVSHGGLLLLALALGTALLLAPRLLAEYRPWAPAISGCVTLALGLWWSAAVQQALVATLVLFAVLALACHRLARHAPTEARSAPAPAPGGAPAPGSVPVSGGVFAPDGAPVPGSAPAQGAASGPGGFPVWGSAPAQGAASGPGGAPGPGSMPASGSASEPGGFSVRGGAPVPGGTPGWGPPPAAGRPKKTVLGATVAELMHGCALTLWTLALVAGSLHVLALAVTPGTVTAQWWTPALVVLLCAAFGLARGGAARFVGVALAPVAVLIAGPALAPLARLIPETQQASAVWRPAHVVLDTSVSGGGATAVAVLVAGAAAVGTAWWLDRSRWPLVAALVAPVALVPVPIVLGLPFLAALLVVLGVGAGLIALPLLPIARTLPAVQVSPAVPAPPRARALPGAQPRWGAQLHPGAWARPGAHVQPDVRARPGVQPRSDARFHPGAHAQPGVRFRPGARFGPGAHAPLGAHAQPDAQTPSGAHAQPWAQNPSGGPDHTQWAPVLVGTAVLLWALGWSMASGAITASVLSVLAAGVLLLLRLVVPRTRAAGTARALRRSATALWAAVLAVGAVHLLLLVGAPDTAVGWWWAAGAVTLLCAAAGFSLGRAGQWAGVALMPVSVLVAGPALGPLLAFGPGVYGVWNAPDAALWQPAHVALATSTSEGPLTAVAVLVAGAAAVGATWLLDRDRLLLVGALVAPVALVPVPIVLGLPFLVALLTALAVGTALVAVAARSEDSTVDLWGPGLTGALVLVWAFGWSLAVDHATVVALLAIAVAGAFAAALARTAPVAVLATSAATGATGGAALAVPLVLGLPVEHAALVPIALTAAVAAAAPRLRSPLAEAAEVPAALWALLALALAVSFGTRGELVALGLAVLGVVALCSALRPNRRVLALGGTALMFAALWTALGSWNVTVPEAYTVPPALAALAVGWEWSRRAAGPAQPSSWLAHSGGLLLLLVPSMAVALFEGESDWRVVAVIAVGLAVTLWGLRSRLRAPLTIGGGALLVVSVRAFGGPSMDLLVMLPNWIPFAVVGALLLTVGARYEASLRGLRNLRRAYSAMR